MANIPHNGLLINQTLVIGVINVNKTLYWVYINVNVAFNGRKLRWLVCHVPDTDHKSACTYNFAAYDKRLYPNPLHPLVDYMIQPQNTLKSVKLTFTSIFVHLRCCLLRPHPGILLSLYNVHNKQITLGVQLRWQLSHGVNCQASCIRVLV